MEWVVIKWNKPALDFYKTLGAVEMDEFVSVLVLSDYAYTDPDGKACGSQGKIWLLSSI